MLYQCKMLDELFTSKKFQDDLWRRHDRETYIAIIPDEGERWRDFEAALRRAGWRRSGWSQSRMGNYKLWTYILRRPKAYKINRGW
jgi:hypothetical protein